MALCPHCQNALPEATVRYCPHCGSDLAPTGVVFTPPPIPAGASASAGGEPGGVPWEGRGRLGILDALFETTREVLASPAWFFRRMPKSGGIGAPLGYAVLVGWVGLVAASFYQAILHSVGGPSWPFFVERPEWAGAIAVIEGWLGFVVQAIFAPVFITIGVFIGAGIFHLMLLLLGAARRDFEATFRVTSYAQATAVLLLIPFCGQLVATVWAIVLYVIGLAEVHETSRGRAAAAVLLPLLLICCCCGAFLAVLLAGGLAAFLSQLG